jgi:hypothetical protein
MMRAVALTMMSASAVVAFDGCTAARRVSEPQSVGADPAVKAAGAEETPKKEYQWKDMSTGSSFYGKSKATPQ